MNKDESQVFNENELHRLHKAVDVLDEAAGIDSKSLDVESSWKTMRAKLDKLENQEVNLSRKEESFISLISAGFSSMFSSGASTGVFITSIGIALSVGFLFTGQFLSLSSPHTVNIDSSWGATLLSEDKIPEIGQESSIESKNTEKIGVVSSIVDEILSAAISAGLDAKITSTNYGFDLIVTEFESKNEQHNFFRQRFDIPPDAGNSVKFVIETSKKSD